MNDDGQEPRRSRSAIATTVVVVVLTGIVGLVVIRFALDQSAAVSAMRQTCESIEIGATAESVTGMVEADPELELVPIENGLRLEKRFDGGLICLCDIEVGEDDRAGSVTPVLCVD